jgi:hypothetical protein
VRHVANNAAKYESNSLVDTTNKAQDSHATTAAQKPASIQQGSRIRFKATEGPKKMVPAPKATMGDGKSEEKAKKTPTKNCVDVVDKVKTPSEDDKAKSHATVKSAGEVE